MTADDLATPGARASLATVLTQLSLNITVLAQHGQSIVLLCRIFYRTLSPQSGVPGCSIFMAEPTHMLAPCDLSGQQRPSGVLAQPSGRGSLAVRMLYVFYYKMLTNKVLIANNFVEISDMILRLHMLMMSIWYCTGQLSNCELTTQVQNVVGIL